MKTSNKILFWILMIVVIAVLIFIAVRWPGRKSVNKNAPAKIDDTTSNITSDLNSVNLGSPESDVKQLDSDINRLK